MISVTDMELRFERLSTTLGVRFAAETVTDRDRVTCYAALTRRARLSSNEKLAGVGEEHRTGNLISGGGRQRPVGVQAVQERQDVPSGQLAGLIGHRRR